MQKAPLTTMLVLLFAVMAAHFSCTVLITVSPLTHLMLDALLIAGVAAIMFGMFDMVPELSIWTVGFLAVVIGYVAEDWFELLGWNAQAGLAISQIFLFCGLTLALYGAAKFQEKFKFK